MVSKIKSTLFMPMMFSVIILTVATYDIFVPNLVKMRHYFQTTEFMMQVSVMMSPLVGAFSGLFHGHYSDVYGRKPIVFIIFFIVGLGSLLSGIASQVEFYLLGRFIQAIGTGGLINVVMAMLADKLSGVMYARSLATISLLFPLTYAVAPNIGVYLEEIYGWQSSFYFIFILCVLMIVLFYFFVDETLSHKNNQSRLKNILVTLSGLTQSKHFVTLALLHALPIAVPLMFITTNSFLFVQEYQVSAKYYAVLLLLPVFFSFFSNLIYKQTIEKIGFQKAYFIGFIIMCLCLFFSSLFYFFGSQEIFNVLFLNAMYCMSISYIATTAATQSIDIRPNDKGVVIAFLATVRNLVMGLGCFIVSWAYDKTAFPLYITTSVVAVFLIFLYSYYRKLSPQVA